MLRCFSLLLQHEGIHHIKPSVFKNIILGNTSRFFYFPSKLDPKS